MGEVEIGEATVVVGHGVLRVEADSFDVVLDGPLVLALVIKGEATVVVGLGILRVEADSVIVVLDGPLLPAQVMMG